MLTVLRVLWPALIPLLGYASWCVWRWRKMGRGEAVAPLGRGLFWALLASAGIAAFCFFALGLSQKSQEVLPYEPSHYRDGKLVPGGFGREKSR
jgi:hypothetical protein